ncbi:uncharacterized protein [Typha angustifolia]|uniref:uncharacterized protein n=1 Tax=Typha angustifolia TaxID=59011 RepID=UPI003C2E0FD5
MDSYTLHVAVAALLGASFAGISAYYMHSQTLSQLLDFARAVETDRDRDFLRRSRRDGSGGDDAATFKRPPRRSFRRREVSAADLEVERKVEEWPVMINGMALEPTVVEERSRSLPVPSGFPRIQEGNT